MMHMVYRVIMYPITCPEERCSLGYYLSEYAAEQVIEKERQHYTDGTVFEIETDYSS